MRAEQNGGDPGGLALSVPEDVAQFVDCHFESSVLEPPDERVAGLPVRVRERGPVDAAAVGGADPAERLEPLAQPVAVDGEAVHGPTSRARGLNVGVPSRADRTEISQYLYRRRGKVPR